MSERFSKLFILPSSLYTVGAPVTISAGALLKDNQSGNIYVQLKFKSISDKQIKALKVTIAPFDTTGQPLGQVVEYQYLDLTARRGEDFGQKTPISMPEKSTRSFSVAVDEVIFTDNSTWNANGVAWEPFPAPHSLADMMPDWNIRQQFQIDIGKTVEYSPERHHDLWYCACGALNHENEAACINCGLKLENLLAASQSESLEEHYQKRKAEEEAKATVEAEKQAEETAKAKKTIKLAATIAIIFIVTIFSMKAWRMYQLNSWLGDSITISAGNSHTVALKSNGSVIASGANKSGQCDVSSWKNIVSVATGGHHTVGLKTDGTVVAVGDNDYGQCDVYSWTDIVSIAATTRHTVGLKADGTVVAVGDNDDGQCDVSNWMDIVSIAAGTYHTVGLRADGTVTAVGWNNNNQCNVSDWTDIVAIATGYDYTVGLKADGTVVAVGNNEYGQCDVSNWKNIIDVYARYWHTVGLKPDGTVVTVGDNDCGQWKVSDWTDIVAVAIGSDYTVGLKVDGTVVAVGDNKDGQCDVSGWKNIRVPESGR